MTNNQIRNWHISQLEDQSGKRFLITGGNSGVGFATAKHLLNANAEVLIACRSEEKGRNAIRELQEISSRGSATLILMDLSEMDSVKQAAITIRNLADGLDGIVNNAGIAVTPYKKTKDGFELQFATNHLGHFLLNYLLFDLIEARSGRIVPVSSMVHRQSRGIQFQDPMLHESYSVSTAYSQSKLANMMYGLELARRLESAGSPVKSIIAHPGGTSSNLLTGLTGPQRYLWKLINAMALTPEIGSFSEVLAVAGTEAVNGSYYGPTRFGESRGPVGNSRISAVAQDLDSAKRLWEMSEELLKIKWDI